MYLISTTGEFARSMVVIDWKKQRRDQTNEPDVPPKPITKLQLDIKVTQVRANMG